MTVVSEILINSTPERVFSLLSVLKNHYLWNPSLKKLSSEGALKLGSHYEADSLILKKTSVKSRTIIESFEPNKSITFKSRMGTINYTQHFSLNSQNNQTLLHTEVNILTKSQPFGLTVPVLKELANTELNTDLSLLKIAAEKPPKTVS